jgi:hypothetical protein
MRVLLNILFWGLMISLFYGFYHKQAVDYTDGEKWIGFTVLGLTFIYLPIFLFHRWNGKKLSDYTLTDENFAKMRNEKTKKSENQ